MSKDGGDDPDPLSKRESLGINNKSGSVSNGSVRFSNPLNVPNLENKYESILGETTKDLSETFVPIDDSVPELISEPVSVLDQDVSSVVNNIITGMNYIDVDQIESTAHTNSVSVSFGEELIDEFGYKEAETNASVFENNAGSFDTNTAVLDSNAAILDTSAGAPDTNTGAIDTNARALDSNAGRSDTNARALDSKAAVLESNTGGSDTNAGAFETLGITPEDIFDDIKVAHAEKAEIAGAQNLHSIVISKSYSSENVVVLLNLRRMKDGEWVLDKTIAQGLKPETYGGVISIDEYGLSANQSNQSSHPANPVSKSTATSIRPPIDEESNTEPDPIDANAAGADIMEVLKKMEDYVANVNRQIAAARKLAKYPPGCPESNVGPSNSKPFDELSFGEQLIKMFTILVSQDSEGVNLCDNCEDCVLFEGNTQKAVKDWLQSLIDSICSLCGWKLQLFRLLPSFNENMASAAQLLAQSRAILQQASQSGVVIQLAAKGSALFNLLPTPSNSEADLSVVSKDEKINLLLASAGTLELNIESKANLDEFLSRNQNE